MKRGIALFLLGLAIGGGTVFAAFRWHFVRADDGWHVVGNGGSSFDDCYADVRGWTASDWAEHPRLATALADAGQGDVIMRTSANGMLDRLMNRR